MVTQFCLVQWFSFFTTNITVTLMLEQKIHCYVSLYNSHKSTTTIDFILFFLYLFLIVHIIELKRKTKDRKRKHKAETLKPPSRSRIFTQQFRFRIVFSKYSKQQKLEE